MDVRVVSYFETLLEKDDNVPRSGKQIGNSTTNPNIQSHVPAIGYSLFLKPGDRLYTDDTYESASKKD